MATLRSLPVFDEKGSLNERPLSLLWRSLEERIRGGADRADVLAEFAHGASEMPKEWDGAKSGTSRRGFVQLMGASAALAGLAACTRKPHEQILPYTRQPEGITPGRATHYATATFLGGRATGLLATSYEGRPTKIDGNPQHPSSLGGTGVIDQGSLLSLYDPQRANVVTFKGADRAWRAFQQEQLARALENKAKDQGAGVRFLMEPSSSPTQAWLRERILAQLPQAKFYAYQSLASEGWQEAAQVAFGAPAEVRLELKEADVIVSLDADFLSGLPGTLALQRAFADRRDPKAGEMNRLYAIESAFTLTGAAADHRLPVRPSELPAAALGLLARVARATKSTELVPYAALSPALSPEQSRFLDAAAGDLVRAAGKSAVIAGDRQPASVHLAALAINAALGNPGKTVRYARSVLLDAEDGPKALSALAAEIKAGKVDTLVITAHNPAYTAPIDLEFGKLLQGVPNGVYLGTYRDETAACASWFVPRAHALESWGDGLAHDGTVTFQQPLIAPLFNGVTELELLAALLGEADRGSYSLLRASWDVRSKTAGVGETVPMMSWEKWIADGFASGTARTEEPGPIKWESLPAAIKPGAPAGGLELFFAADARIYDGRFGNNAWLQELPDPVTKVTWDNAALLSPATAKRLGVEMNDVVDVKLSGRTVRAAVFVQPGQAPETVQLSLGYGRTSTAEDLAHERGYNANLVRTAAAFWSAGGVELSPVPGAKLVLSQTQEHHSMEGRSLALQTTREQLEKGEIDEIKEEASVIPTMYEAVDYSKGHKWSLAIDLSKCTGCSACITACQAENNIPVVGKEQVFKSREMHWLRLDRYYLGDEAAPEMITQPVMCQQCENAPCEYVCPVNATSHSDEGLNDMVYNRCVGTRYCSNNCPYKVRRFNFFSYTSNYADVEKMVMNPDVTVRARGVMEKCTYCVQRIERARIDTRVAGTEIKDGDVKTACQEACPSRAITFGSLNDPRSAASQQYASPRRYDLLHELGTRPRTVYLARVKNPNPEFKERK